MSPTTPASHDSLAAGASAANSSDKSQWAISRGKPSARRGWSGLSAHGVNSHDVADSRDRRDATRRRTREQPIGRHDTVVDNAPQLKAGLGEKQLNRSRRKEEEMVRRRHEVPPPEVAASQRATYISGR